MKFSVSHASPAPPSATGTVIKKKMVDNFAYSLEQALTWSFYIFVSMYVYCNKEGVDATMLYLQTL